MGDFTEIGNTGRNIKTYVPALLHVIHHGEDSCSGTLAFHIEPFCWCRAQETTHLGADALRKLTLDSLFMEDAIAALVLAPCTRGSDNFTRTLRADLITLAPWQLPPPAVLSPNPEFGDARSSVQSQRWLVVQTRAGLHVLGCNKPRIPRNCRHDVDIGTLRLLILSNQSSSRYVYTG